MNNREKTAAHNHSRVNRAEVEQSIFCACFYCIRTFAPEEIVEWIRDDTALCPHCCIDAVIGTASGYPLSKDWLMEMHRYWWFVDCRRIG